MPQPVLQCQLMTHSNQSYALFLLYESHNSHSYVHSNQTVHSLR